MKFKKTKDIIDYIKKNFDENVNENIYIGELVYKFFHKDYNVLYIDNSEELGIE